MSTWRAVGASRRGPRHDDNQDRYAIARLPGRLLVVVSDGAGSALCAAEGAQAAVDAVLVCAQQGESRTAEETVRACWEAARVALDDDRDRAATLVIAVLDDPGSAEAVVAVASVGDSPAIVERTDGERTTGAHEVAGPATADEETTGDEVAGEEIAGEEVAGEQPAPDSPFELWQPVRESEYVNYTEFLTSPDVTPTIWTAPAGAVRSVMLGSDGIAFASIGHDGPTPGFFLPLRTRAEAASLDVAALLEYLADKELLDDDTTLVVATLESEQA